MLALALGGCSAGIEMQEYLSSGSRVELTIGGQKLTAEIAADRNARRTGLMFRKPEDLPENHGMLFVMGRKEEQSFHMLNTEIPLSIAFIADDGEILQIEHMKPKDERSTRSKEQVQYALEVHQGWFQKHGIQVGDKIESFPDVVARIRMK